jgi:hypothetical protein
LPDGHIAQNLSSPVRKNIPLNPSGKSALPARPVPTFFVVVQRFENWLAGRKGETPAPQTINEAPSVTP